MDLAYGFLRTEGVIEERSDIHAISYVGPNLKNTIDIVLATGVSLEKKKKGPNVISLLPVLVVFVARQV